MKRDAIAASRAALLRIISMPDPRKLAGTALTTITARAQSVSKASGRLAAAIITPSADGASQPVAVQARQAHRILRHGASPSRRSQSRR